MLLPQVDSLIFDVDGVLIDIESTIHATNAQAVDFYFDKIVEWGPIKGLLKTSEIDLFKTAGGFNSDWDLTKSVVLLYLYKWVHYRVKDPEVLRRLSPTLPEYTAGIASRGGWIRAAQELIQEIAAPEELREIQKYWDPETIVHVFQEIYGGEFCPELYHYQPHLFEYPAHRGLIHQDKSLVDVSMIPRDIKLGIVTGRTFTETVFGLRLIGLDGRIPSNHWVTDDDGIWKPDPLILKRVTEKLGTRIGIYVGDTLDDLRTVQMHQAAMTENGERTELLSCQVLTGPGTDPARRDRFIERGADIVADSINDLLRCLQ